MKLEILLEDDDLVVVNKPAGVVVNDAKTVQGQTIQSWMRQRLIESKQPKYQQNWRSLVPTDFDARFGSPEEIFKQRSGLVHRLDKDTSGVLVLAKNPGSLVNLLKQFKNRRVSKKYQCLVHGQLKVSKATLSYPIARLPVSSKKFGVVAEGRQAETEYRLLEQFAGLDQAKLKVDTQTLKKIDRLYQGFSLVECSPKTGRTHQIRVHFAHIKHPVVGDKLYLGKKRLRLDESWCPRQFLHASNLSIEHPRTKKTLTVEADLANDLKTAFSFLQS